MTYNPGWTMHAIKCFKDFCDQEKKAYNFIQCQQLLEDFAVFLLVQGVKIGGIYQHFKGPKYKVTAVNRDATDWSRWRVCYVQVDDVSHEGNRFVDEFLGLHESGVRRFTLVS
jgi:hypothetical protein